jgi:hypothetical protein
MAMAGLLGASRQQESTLMNEDDPGFTQGFTDLPPPEPHVKPGTEIEFPLPHDDLLDGPRYTSDRDGLKQAAAELVKARAANAPQPSVTELISRHLRITR